MIRCINNYNHNAEDSAYLRGRKPCLKSLLQFFEGGSKHTDTNALLDVGYLNFQRDFDMVVQQGLVEKRSDHGVQRRVFLRSNSWLKMGYKW